MIRTYLALMSLVAVSTGALAHQDGTLHSHPHLLVSNELIAAVLLTAFTGLCLGVRHVIKKRVAARKRNIR